MTTSKTDALLQRRFGQFNLRIRTVTHNNPSVIESAEYEALWKDFVAVSNEYKPEYTEEEMQAVIDAIDKLLEFLSDK